MVSTKKKSAPKSTNKSKTPAIKVARRPKHAPPSKKTKKVVPELPSDWPVASRPPVYPPNASALAPGSLLQHNCSGQDIHLAKSAVTRPNLAKEKGKYLIIFPGNLGLKTIAKATDEKNDNDDNNEVQIKGPKSQSTVDGENLTKKSSVPTLGQMQDLSTDHPKLVVPFPGGKSLIFPGKKVESMSKYIMLSCSTKKKGSIACKSIFSSAIVFGQPTWEKKVQGNQKDEKDMSRMDTSSDEKVAEEKESSQPMLHYGGSQRTVDGIGKGKKATAMSQSSSSSSFLVPIHSKQTKQPQYMSVLEQDFLKESEPSKSTVQTTTTTSLALDGSSSDGDDDDEYNFDGKGTISLADSATKRLAPKRKAASRQKYTLSSSDSSGSSSEEETDDDDGDDRQDGESKTKTKVSASKRAAAQVGRKSTTTKVKGANKVVADGEDGKSTRAKKKQKTTGTRKKPVIVVVDDNGDNDDDEDGDDDDASYSEGGDEVLVSTKRRQTSRRSTSSTKPKYNEESDGDSDEEESSEEEEKPKTKKKVTTSKSRDSKNQAPTKSKTIINKMGKGEKEEINLLESENENDGDVINLEEESEVKSSSSSSNLKNKSTPKVVRKPPTPSTVVDLVDDTKVQFKAQKSPQSPFRSRRRKSPGGKADKAPARKTLDLADEDEFSFR